MLRDHWARFLNRILGPHCAGRYGCGERVWPRDEVDHQHDEHAGDAA
jgi:hypothetical protein